MQKWNIFSALHGKQLFGDTQLPSAADDFCSHGNIQQNPKSRGLFGHQTLVLSPREASKSSSLSRPGEASRRAGLGSFIIKWQDAWDLGHWHSVTYCLTQPTTLGQHGRSKESSPRVRKLDSVAQLMTDPFTDNSNTLHSPQSPNLCVLSGYFKRNSKFS